MKIKTWYGTSLLGLGLCAGLALGAGCKKNQNAQGQKPPEMTRVEIRPESPTPGQNLDGAVDYRSESAGKVVLDFRWSVNDQVKLEGEGKSTLPGAMVTPGAKIGLEVRAREGDQGGPWMSASPVQVGEEVVKLMGVSLEPQEAFRNTTLEAKVDAGEAAAESLTLYYRWLVNDQPVENASDPTLDHDAFRHGDKVVVEVSTDREFAPGQTRHSGSVQIKNLPPEIKSAFGFSWDGEKFVYQMDATDPDDDPLKYFLEKGPPGMTIDPKTGLVTWKPATRVAGVYEVKVGVDDGLGGKVGQQGQMDLGQAQPAPATP